MRKIIPIAVASAVVAAASGGTFAYAAADKQVTVSVDGQQQTINTFSGTVGGVLADRGIKVGEHDQVAPAADAKLSEGTEIAVQYGRPVTVQVDGKSKTFWTTAKSVGDAMKLAGMDKPQLEVSTSRDTAIGRKGLSWTVDSVKQVTITADGKSKKLKTSASTVGAALQEAKISADDDDLVSTPKSAALKNGETIKVTDVVTKTEKKTESVDFKSTERKTKSLEQGETQVETEGKAGERTSTYLVTSYDGKEHQRRLISKEITTEPIDKVTLVGTGEVTEDTSDDEATDDETSSDDSSNDDGSADDNSSSDDKSDSDDSGSDDSGSDDSGSDDSSDDGAPSVPSGSVWDKIAECESGGDWSINTGNGFYGGLQFTLQTWHGFGGSGMPNNASREEQIRIAKKVQAEQGWGAWPVCSGKAGLR
ncbi:resuscitation-promoting factor [Microlunatus soli]|uniref:Uncharacterized conserved protein YabE, contains G5 and tandem DUF348 domains n=1 Tax=Microlunatus soli TaxID=630515 RepID=A0A1H1R4T7_9ACTN|nr:resuscitation-promoting factor [Microlunatus soli]SDS30536.1 Uncharacterized conserved protein YabE, contains G5 and tandem DUF348 domains [Microlunatus soli]